MFFNIEVLGRLLIRLTCWPKVRLFGERDTVEETFPVPLPDNPKICGLVIPLCVTATDPVIFPTFVGEKVTPIVQDPPGGNDGPQLFVSEKLPLALMLSTFSGCACLFVSFVFLTA